MDKDIITRALEHYIPHCEAQALRYSRAIDECNTRIHSGCYAQSVQEASARNLVTMTGLKEKYTREAVLAREELARFSA